MQKNKEIIYFLPYITGGVTSFVFNLLKFRPQSDIYYKVILYREKERKADNFEMKFNANEQIVFDYSSKENLYSVFRRLKKHISTENSFLVANDGLEIRMSNSLKLKNPLIYIVHGDFEYYYQLSKNNEQVIDKFITVSKHIENQLKNKFSIKKVTITEYVPVKNVRFENNKQNSFLKLIFVGILCERKGVQFFKEIIENLSNKIENFEFIIVGSGEKENILKNDFYDNSKVKFLGQLQNDEVLKLCLQSDILLFPVLAEGLPVVLVEAMKCGCVPVVSDIPSGIPELVFDGITGYKIKVGDTYGFANAIEHLYKNPELLQEMSVNAQKHANEMFDAYKQAEKYEKLILSTTTENKTFSKQSIGRVLNKPFLPNFLVKAVRLVIKHPKI